jgi:uncharacterized membrane protein
MAITASDIKLRFSVSAAAGNTTAGSGATSLGDQISTTDIPSGEVDVLFDAVTGTEADAGDVEYRCVFVLNDHATLTLTDAYITVQSDAGGGATTAIALDNIAISAKGSGSAQAATIADETAAPTGVGSFGTGPLTIGDLAPGECKAVWIRRTVPADTSAAASDGCTLRVGGDTLP